MANHERAARNIFRGASLLFVGELAMAWLASDAAAEPLKRPAIYVDCAKQPGGSASAQFDALRRQELFVGDMQTDANGRPEKWRTVFDIDTIYNLGEIGVTVDGFGPIVQYADLPHDGLETTSNALITSDRGERLNMSQAPHPEVSAHAPVLVTYTCATAR